MTRRCHDFCLLLSSQAIRVTLDLSLFCHSCPLGHKWFGAAKYWSQHLFPCFWLCLRPGTPTLVHKTLINVPEYGAPGQHDQAQPAPSHQDAEISKFSSFCQIRLHTICSLDTNDRFLSALWHFGHRESFQGKGFWDHSQPYHPPPFTSVVVPKEGGVVDGLQAVTIVPVVCRLGRALLLLLGL